MLFYSEQLIELAGVVGDETPNRSGSRLVIGFTGSVVVLSPRLRDYLPLLFEPSRLTHLGSSTSAVSVKRRSLTRDTTSRMTVLRVLVPIEQRQRFDELTFSAGLLCQG